MRGHRQFAVKRNAAVPGEAPAFAFRAETQIFELDDHRDREAVVELGDIDVRGFESGPGESGTSGIDSAGRRQRLVFADVAVAQAVTLAEQTHRGLAQIPCALDARNDTGSRAVGYERAVEHVQRRSRHGGVEHVLYGDELALMRIRIHAGVPPHRYGDLRELLRRRAVLVHVTLSNQRIQRGNQRAVRNFELRMCRAAFGHAPDRVGARAVRQQVLSGHAQYRVGLAGRDRKRGLMDHGAAGRAGKIDSGKKFRSDPQVTCDHAARHAPLIDAYGRREQAIDVGKPEPGILERGQGGVRL